MPKIISPEMKFRATSLFYFGYSRDEISQKLGIGTGTISKYLEEFRREIGKTTFEAIKAWGRFLSKNQILPTDAMTGIRISKLIQRYNIDEENLNLFFENLSSINVDSGVTQLLQAANQLLEIEKTTGKSHQAILAKFDKLSKAMPVLENNKQKLESAIQILDDQRDDLFKQNKTTEKEISQFIVIKSEYSKIGLKLEEIPKYYNALLEIKHLGYDVTKVLEYIKEIGSLEKHIEIHTKTISKYNQSIEASKKKLDSITNKTNQLIKEFAEYSFAIKLILKFVCSGQDPSSMIQWNKIIKQNKMTVTQFDKEMQHYDKFTNYLYKISNEITLLVKQKQELVSQLNDHKKEKCQLEDRIKLAKVKLDEKIENAIKEIQTLKVTNPLRMICQQKGNPEEVLPMAGIFLSQLKAWLEVHNIKKHGISFRIEYLIKELGKLNPYE